ncbi:MAG: hypothetical protein ACOX5F_05125 [Anaerovoracaceae bacterium]|jgi:stage III sporulation protein AB
MIKFLLYILIIAGASISGMLKAKSFDNRVFHLQDFISTLKILESEMKYLMDPLPEIFKRIQHIKRGMTSMLFQTTWEMLQEDQTHNFSQCWEKAVYTVYNESSLTREDKEIIVDFGMNIGKTDIENQLNIFSRTSSLLEGQVKEAIEHRTTKGKMYKSLGVAIGILVVIILI